jgi:hypothetical protein
MGYAKTRTVPLRWIWLGVILTLLDSWNAEWTWVALNILLSLALIRIARPYVQILLQHYGWAAFALLISALLAVLPIAEKTVDYGAEGWLWALFGLFQRMYVDGRSAPDMEFTAQPRARDQREGGIHAPAGLYYRCGRLRLARTKGILVSSYPFRRLYSRRWPLGLHLLKCAGNQRVDAVFSVGLRV